MADVDDYDMSQGDSGAALTEPIRAGEIKKGMIVMLKGKPCKVISVTTSKTGKHGHAKANITGLDIFTGKKYEDISPTSHNMTKPAMHKFEYSLMDIAEDGFLSLYDDASGDTREDLELPDGDLGDRIKDAFENGQEVSIQVVSAMGTEKVMDCKLGATQE